LVEFITHGISAEERAHIGAPPRGLGILGLLIHDPRPRRLADLGTHPDSYGFPPNHPPMHTFLGAPIRIRDEVFGNLYLAERMGETEFSEADEAMLVALASAAGFAIDNARLYERSEQQRRWERAIREMTQDLLESPDEDSTLTSLAERVCVLVEAGTCAVALADGGGHTAVRALHRQDELSPPGAVARHAGPQLDRAHWSEVLGSGEELLLLPGSQPSTARRVADDLADAAGLSVSGPTAILPMAAGAAAIGHLIVQWQEGREDLASSVMAPLSGFAQQVAVGIVAARAQRDRAMVAMLEDRDRIARDMHDHVIQRLFATGLSLQAATRLAIHPVVRSRLDEAVDSLDVAIKDIRSTIFELHASVIAGEDVESELRGLLDSYAVSLGSRPELHLVGDLRHIPAALAVDLMAVVREGLSNVSRHAQASLVQVEVSVGAALTVVVTDNGQGMSAQDRRSGLANLERRALARSGSFQIDPIQPSGTRVTWSAPLEAEEAGTFDPAEDT
jgi:signal transduction histidine kinase